MNQSQKEFEGSARYLSPLKALGSAAGRIGEVVDGLPAEAHDWRPEPGAWTARELVAHLANADPPFLGRLRRMLEEESPAIRGFGPETALPEPWGQLPELLAAFRHRRQELLALLSGLEPEGWERVALHERRGRTTVALEAQVILEHDAEHLAQLYELRRAWENKRV